MKIRQRLIGLGAGLALLLGLLLPAPLVLAGGGGVTVTVDAPDEVVAGSDFIARLNINYVENFNACGVGVRFDPAILSLTDVTEGEIDGTTIPIVAFVEGDPGAAGVVTHLEGSSAVTGSGYLMELHFSTLADGNIEINLVKCSMSDNDAQLIPATWVGVGNLAVNTDGTPSPSSPPADAEASSSLEPSPEEATEPAIPPLPPSPSPKPINWLLIGSVIGGVIMIGIIIGYVVRRERSW